MKYIIIFLSLILVIVGIYITRREKIGVTWQEKIYLYQEKNIYEPGDKLLFWAKFGKKEQLIVGRVVRIGGNVYETDVDTGDYGKRGAILPRLILGRIIY